MLSLVALSVAAIAALVRVHLDHTVAWEEEKLNADIGGIGVLVGLYFPVLLTFLSLGVGHLHSLDSGTTEIGATVLISEYCIMRPKV